MSANLMSLARSGGKFLKLFGDRKMVKTMPTARDYVQDGLIAMWDGIENAGWGVHDPNATVWTDLVNGMGITLIEQAMFSENSLRIVATDETLATAYMTLPYRVARDTIGTKFGGGTGRLPYQSSVRTVFRLNELPSSIAFCQYDVNGGGNCLVVSNNRIYRKYGPAPSSLSMATFVTGIAISEVLTTETNYDDDIEKYRCTHYTSDYCDLTMDYEVTTGTYTEGRITARPCLNLPLSLNAQSYRPSTASCKDIEFLSIAIYNRVLASAEVAANYAIDKARFNLPD